ncbi:MULTISPECIES: hypothetical protein [Pontibacillus]|uniref:YfhD family protein n=1 Tax=Pontibacillus chungwhensis TaxID=265426 RepID=A0ABY8UZB8_9BACI|nr:MULTISPECIES: hypothetical protein [Pontibacillus]MCD5325403.1 hypothetical protein [Pontibacillus sp. HN14]WIF98518.1 hypothetical protein QNI29_02290 [Pontibacillus chungwhensis]
MAKKTKKHDAEQKHKKGFEPKKMDVEFGQEVAGEFGSAAANKAHKESAKRARKSKNPEQN